MKAMCSIGLLAELLSVRRPTSSKTFPPKTTLIQALNELKALQCAEIRKIVPNNDGSHTIEFIQD